MADAADSKSADGDIVRVRVSPQAPHLIAAFESRAGRMPRVLIWASSAAPPQGRPPGGVERGAGGDAHQYALAAGLIERVARTSESGATMCNEYRLTDDGWDAARRLVSTVASQLQR